MIWLKTFGRPGVECDDLKENCRVPVPSKKKKEKKEKKSLLFKVDMWEKTKKHTNYETVLEGSFRHYSGPENHPLLSSTPFIPNVNWGSR